MSGYNKAIIVGNAGKDPETRVFDNGKKVARVNLATSEKNKAPSGEETEITEWHLCVFWDSLADTVSKYVKKGQQILVEGTIHYKNYVNKSGQTVNYTEITCYKLVLLGRKESDNKPPIELLDKAQPKSEAKPEAKPDTKKMSPAQAKQQFIDEFDLNPSDDDLPF